MLAEVYLVTALYIAAGVGIVALIVVPPIRRRLRLEAEQEQARRQAVEECDQLLIESRAESLHHASGDTADRSCNDAEQGKTNGC